MEHGVAVLGVNPSTNGLDVTRRNMAQALVDGVERGPVILLSLVVGRRSVGVSWANVDNEKDRTSYENGSGKGAVGLSKFACLLEVNL